jgi:hypothetical protein
MLGLHPPVKGEGLRGRLKITDYCSGQVIAFWY